jgi:hypothetical protein
LLDFTGVLSADIGRVWPFVQSLVESVAERSNGRLRADDVRQALDQGKWQLWIAHDNRQAHALCLTEILIYPQMKTCRLVAATGHDRAEWVDYLKIIEAWAAANGCELMETWARPGWRRVLKDYTWTHVQLEKKLCPVQSPKS